MDIQLIDTGFFHADGGAMFGAIPKTAWSRRYPSDEQNGCILAMRTLLVRDGNGKIVLVDNGAGNKHLKQLSYYNFFDLVDLKEELQRRGVACEEVTDIHRDKSHLTSRHLSAHTSSQAMSSRWRQVFHLSGSPHTTLVPSYPTTRKCECWKRRP